MSTSPFRPLAPHRGLLLCSRVTGLSATDDTQARDVTLLMGFGVTAAVATAWLDLSLRIPGHAILRAVLPMALGLALVPRHFAGTLMGLSALTAAFGFHASGLAHPGVGAVASLCLTGPAMDAALARASKGWHIYLGLTLAGLGTNLVALAMRAAPKTAGADRAAARALAGWWSEASVTYPVCGIAAGLLAAAAFFHATRRRREEWLP